MAGTRRDLPITWTPPRRGIYRRSDAAAAGVFAPWGCACPSSAALRTIHTFNDEGLGVAVINQFGLRPALVKGKRQIAPLTVKRNLDELGLLNGLTTFNLHPYFPPYSLTGADA